VVAEINRFTVICNYRCYVVICRSTNNSVEVFIKIGSYFALLDGEPKRW
jgi:hypothetical protein